MVQRWNQKRNFKNYLEANGNKTKTMGNSKVLLKGKIMVINTCNKNYKMISNKQPKFTPSGFSKRTN